MKSSLMELLYSRMDDEEETELIKYIHLNASADVEIAKESAGKAMRLAERKPAENKSSLASSITRSNENRYMNRLYATQTPKFPCQNRSNAP
jgi:hypothetical protein